MADPTEMAVPFVLKDGDTNQQALFALQTSGALISWMVGLSDSTDAPTTDSDDQLVTPAGRT